MRAVLRFTASVMMVSGVLLLGDAAATVAWQEPISYLLAQHEQNALEAALDHPPPRVLSQRPLRGDAIGKIDMPSIDDSAFIVEGTDAGDLRKGPGHYSDTPLPGRHGTVGIAGHRTTHGAPFRHIDDLERGDPIALEMPWGTFTYRVTTTRIVDPTDIGVKRDVGHDRLILSACHPLYSAAQRIVVFARFTRREAPEVRPD
jgi:sortase A